MDDERPKRLTRAGYRWRTTYIVAISVFGVLVDIGVWLIVGPWANVMGRALPGWALGTALVVILVPSAVWLIIRWVTGKEP